jgi:hypothetical protein
MSKNKSREFGWIGHASCNDNSEPCKAALQCNSQGTRGRERPSTSWRRTTLNECGKHSWSVLTFITRDREEPCHLFSKIKVVHDNYGGVEKELRALSSTLDRGEYSD